MGIELAVEIADAKLLSPEYEVVFEILHRPSGPTEIRLATKRTVYRSPRTGMGSMITTPPQTVSADEN